MKVSLFSNVYINMFYFISVELNDYFNRDKGWSWSPCLNPFTAKDTIWRPGIITHPEINLLIRYKFYYAFYQPVCY